MQGAMDPNATLGKGLYVLYYKNGSTYPPTVWSIQADGGFEWQFVEYRTMTGWGGPGQPDPIVPVLDKGTSYRNLPNNIYNEIGRCDRNRLYFQSPTGWREDYRWWDKDPLIKDWIISREPLGDETDAFKIGYNDQITPWSNPSSTKTSGETNISIKITNESNNSIELMYYNTYQGALNLPPSKPQNLKVTSPNNWEAQLTWDPNKEPDIISGGMYKIYRCQSSGIPTTYDLIATINAYNNGQPVTSFIDDMIGPSVSSKLYYKISALDNTQLESICSDYDWRMGRVPKIPVDGIRGFEYVLESNYPNPFNPATRINYSIREAGLIKLKVFDILGSEVAELVNEIKEAGNYSVEFNASNLPSGVYIYTLQAGSFVNSKKMILLK